VSPDKVRIQTRVTVTVTVTVTSRGTMEIIRRIMIRKISHLFDHHFLAINDAVALVDQFLSDPELIISSVRMSHKTTNTSLSQT
jgi:hypothetical protein